MSYRLFTMAIVVNSLFLIELQWLEAYLEATM